ncbi:separin [Pholidichthys leucotaenia]
MNGLKVDEYIERTASIQGTELLLQELEKYVTGEPRLHLRRLCDRIIRACNHQLGLGSLDHDHISQLVKLVKLSLSGYDVSAPFVPQSSPLYMEKILFHIVKKLSSLQVHTLCCRVAGWLYDRLSTVPQAEEDYCVLVRCCFSVLWDGISSAKDGKILEPHDKLHCQMQALSFLLLMDAESSSLTILKAAVYAREATNEFVSTCGPVTNEDASFILQEMHTVFNKSWTGGQDFDEGSFKQHIYRPSFYVLCEIVLLIAKMLCEAGHHSLASTFLEEIDSKVSDHHDIQCTPLVLGKWAISINTAIMAFKETAQLLTECARALRSVSDDLRDKGADAILEGCSLVLWAVRSGHSKALSGPVLLALFSFLEEYQELILKMLRKNTACQSTCSRLQKMVCISIYQSFEFAYESIATSELKGSDTLDRVLLYCQATVGLVMTQVRKLSSENLIIKAVVAVTKLACGLFNQRLYSQAFKLVEILCKDLSKSCPVSLSVDQLCRPFMLAVQSSRKAGQYEQALDWVILWLKALGDSITTHMAEPVSLWVKTKIDAARNAEEDIRLRTLRDGFGSDVPDERVMLCLLEEELRAYKEIVGDTAQERYNTLCDLLDICHEESSYTHLRAVYLYEMARVVCFQDFSEQTDCMAVDFIHEALRLLEEEPETPENADMLKDDKAQALLWLYICTLEKNLQEAIENDRKRKELREQTPCVSISLGNNDFDFEDKQKTQDSFLVYEGLHFDLAEEHKLCQPLEKALGLWLDLFRKQDLPSLRKPKETYNSISMAAALFRLMGKPLKALEAYQVAIGLSRQLADVHICAAALLQSANILLDLGSHDLALVHLEQAQKVMSEVTAEEPSSLYMLAILLKAQYYYNIGQVDCGLPYLCEVLKEINKQRHSKSWYLLHARALQTFSNYLSLDSSLLPQARRKDLLQQGVSTPDAALDQSLRLLCSLLVTLVGNCLYGSSSSSSSNGRFIDQGDNLLLKWQLLSELLTCSVKMASIRSSCGAISDARYQCLEALKLAIKLKTLSRCAELLVIKAELELMQGEREESQADLEIIRNLLDRSTDFPDQEQKIGVKIKPRKGRPAKKSQSLIQTMEEDFNDILSTRLIAREPVVKDLSSSPPLKNLPHQWLSSLEHETDCQCACCSEPCLGRATARWAATQGELALQLDPSDTRVHSKLYFAALSRCKSVTFKLGAKLAKLFPLDNPAKGISKPSLMQDVAGHVYLCMSLSRVEPTISKASGIWKILDSGFTFVDSTPSTALRPVKAGLMAAKAIASLIILADKNNCIPEKLFSNIWTWNAPKEDKTLKLKQKTVPASSAHKKPEESVKHPEISAQTQQQKKVKTIIPKIQVTSSTSKERSVVPMTPVMPKSSAKDPFSFSTVVPTLALTPVQKVRGPASVKKAPKTASKLQFHVYEELSPVQDKPQHVPAAPKRTKKSRFKVEFSDESDSEVNASAEPKEKEVTKKRTATRRGGNSVKMAPNPCAGKQPTKVKTRTAVSRVTSSEDDEPFVPKPSSTRRTRKQVSKMVAEEPDIMRTIKEETNEVLDMSIEQLRTSDIEEEGYSASNKDIDFEVLRREISFNLEKDDLFEVRNKGRPMKSSPRHLTPSDSTPDNLTLDDVRSLLRSAWLTLQHLPSPTLYPTICALLALTMGQQDPTTTAMLHSQSLAITSRHRAIRHLATSLKKLKKASNELEVKMDTLSLNEPTVSNTSAEQKLSQMEDIFAFPSADPSAFPHSHCQKFMQQIQQLPPGVTVCVMSVFGVIPGEVGDSMLVSRLEKDSVPITVHISTFEQQHPVSHLVQEIDDILMEQKVVSCVSDKAKWWEGRRALDSRVETLLQRMERLLGCWKGLFLPLLPGPKLSKQAQHLCKALTARGVTVSEDILKVVLSASSLLSREDLKRFAAGISPQWDANCDQLLQTAVFQLSDRDEAQSHVVLILDKYLQKLPWESMSFLKYRSVSRMPSLHSLLGLSFQKEADSQSILRHGVNQREVFYVLDPDANLVNSQERFKEWFASKLDWCGVCGVAPPLGQLEEAVTTKDLYIYVGHGAGARFLDSQSVLKRPMRAASLLLGCSSAALAVRGDQEGRGVIMNYLIAGCPFVLGNLWDVTDRDIDRFTKALLESWISAGSGAPLLDYMGPSRQATHLKHIIGAAPVVYGLPIHLL